MDRSDALSDLAFLEQALEERFAYLKTPVVDHRTGEHPTEVGRPVDHRALFQDLRQRLPAEVVPSWLGLELQKLLAHFIDGHAATNVPPSPLGFLPFLTGAAGERLVAFQPDRSGFLDPDHPYLLAIDGLPIDRWLDAASTYAPRGSPQLV